MHRHVFGNLDEWGRVLERLAELTRSGEIEQHQEDLAMLLRYPDNWRLREAALERVSAIRTPTNALIHEICRIMLNDRLYFHVRVLAAEALTVALERLAECTDPELDRLRRDIAKKVHLLLDAHEVPVVHQAARRILQKVE